MDGFDAAPGNDLSVDLLLAFENGLADSRDEDAIADLIIEGGLRGDSEGEDTPVDAVAAVALGRIFVADVGIAAQNLLAGSGLLAGGAIAGLIGEYA